MSVYTIDKCERFVSQRAGCGKAASPDSARGVRPQGVRLLDPICFAKAVTMKLSKKSVNALNGLTFISTKNVSRQKNSRMARVNALNGLTFISTLLRKSNMT